MLGLLLQMPLLNWLSFKYMELQKHMQYSWVTAPQKIDLNVGYKGAKWTFILHTERSFQEPRQRQKVVCGWSRQKVSLESSQRVAKSWQHAGFGSTLWCLLEDRHKPEYNTSVVKQKAISGGMCRGGDVRGTPVVQKEGKRQHSGERARSCWALLMQITHTDVFPALSLFVGLGITSILPC